MPIRILFGVTLGATFWSAVALAGDDFKPGNSTVRAGTMDRAYAAVDDRLYNATFASWLGGNMISRRALSNPAEIRARAEYLSSLGIRGIELGGMHFRLGWSGEWDTINAITSEIVTACRDNGLLVIEHHDFPLPFYNAYPILARNIDWLQRDVRTGEPFRWFDPLNPGWLGAYTAYLLKMQATARPDGYMLDEVTLSPWYASASDASRHTICDWTGREEPVWADMAKPDLEDPNYRAWVYWRSLVEPAAMAHLFGELRKRQPETISMAYSAGYSTPGNIYDLSHSAASFSNFVGYECIVYDPLQGWQGMMRELIERGSLKDYFHIPIWVYLRQPRTRDQLRVAWIMAHMTRHSTWLSSVATDDPHVLESVRSLARWKDAMPHRHARTLTDTAVLLSHQTRRVSADPDFFQEDFGGWNSTLLENNIPFDVLLDGDLEKSGRVAKYRTLILASQACLSDEQIRNLVEWVRSGGTCILTRNTSIYDEWGTPRADFGLAVPANLRLENRGRRIIDLEGRVGGETFQIPQIPVTLDARPREASKSRVLAVTTRGDEEVPVGVETPFGGGRFIYVAADLGATQFQRELKNGTVYRGEGRGDVRKFLLALLRAARETSPPPVHLDFPQGIAGTVFQIAAESGTGDVYVHILNVRGKSIRKGERSSHGASPEIAMPPVNERIDIRLNLPVKGPAELRSPNGDDTQTVDPVILADGSAIVEIPGSALRDYLQVRIPAERWPGIQPPPVPMGGGVSLPLGEEVLPLAKDQWVPKRTALAAFVESDPSPSVFTINGQGSLFLGDVPIAVGERALGVEPHSGNPAPGTDFAMQDPDAFDRTAGGWRANVAAGESGTGIVWAREIAVRGDDAELTASFRIPKRDHGPAFQSLIHEIRIPLATLRGAGYRARVGLHRVPDPDQEGRLTGTEPEGEQILRYARTVQFEGGAGDFLVDFNPCGPWGVFWEDPGSSFHAHLIRRADHYVFQIEVPWTRYGADVNSKVVFRAGKHRIEDLHPVRSDHYSISLPASKRIQFTSGQTAEGFTQYAARGFGYDKGFQGWGLQRWDSSRGVGWEVLDPSAKLLTADPADSLGPIFSGGVLSRAEGRFRMAHPNAFLLVSLLLSSPQEGAAAEVSVEDLPWRNIPIDPKRLRNTVVFPLVLRDGEIDIRFRGGPWKFSGIVVQPLLYAQEDHSFGRSWWALGRAPWLIPGFPAAERWGDFDTTPFGPLPLEQVINHSQPNLTSESP